MATVSNNDARINFRLPASAKQTIEQAAAITGQTITEFAVATLVHNAQRVIQEHDRTELSNRDRDIFIAMLDDEKARPNKALMAAAKRYSRRIK